jgi:hypothetical protein
LRLDGKATVDAPVLHPCLRLRAAFGSIANAPIALLELHCVG